MERSYNLKKTLEPYVPKKAWVALSPDRKRVVGQGKTLSEALKEAKEKNFKKPTVIKAIPDYSGWAPSFI